MRRIHVELDEAVMAAYGWSDVPLDHGFHTYRQMERWTVSPAARVEILDRLLAENLRRAAAQQTAAAKPAAGVAIAEVRCSRGQEALFCDRRADAGGFQLRAASSRTARRSRFGRTWSTSWSGSCSGPIGGPEELLPVSPRSAVPGGAYRAGEAGRGPRSTWRRSEDGDGLTEVRGDIEGRARAARCARGRRRRHRGRRGRG